MNAVDLLFTPYAANAFRKIIQDVQEVSLLSAERLRSRIFHKLHLIQHHPTQGSKKIELPGISGELRLATVMSYKIYFKVENRRVIVMELLMDKAVKTN